MASLLNRLLSGISGLGSRPVDGSEYFADVFKMWDGSEEVIEWGFKLHDYEEKGVVPYEELEPMLRHILWKIGEVWMVQRFHKASGSSLDSDAIAPYLGKVGVTLRGPIDMNTWKLLCGSWFQLCLDTRAKQVREQQETVAQMQEEQALKYREALLHFAETYAAAIHKRNKEISDEMMLEGRQMLAFGKESIQEAFKRHQQKFIDVENAKAETQLLNAQEKQRIAEAGYMQKFPFECRAFGGTFGQPFDEVAQAPLLVVPTAFRRRETDGIKQKRALASQAQAEAKAAEAEAEQELALRRSLLQEALSRGFSHVAVRVN